MCDFMRNKFNLRYAQREERDMRRDAHFIAAIWRRMGTEIQNQIKSAKCKIALMNGMYRGAGPPFAGVFEVRQAEMALSRVPLGK